MEPSDDLVATNTVCGTTPSFCNSTPLIVCIDVSGSKSFVRADELPEAMKLVKGQYQKMEIMRFWYLDITCANLIM